MNFPQFIARFQRIKWLQPSVIALILANLVPLVAVFIFHWDVFSLLFLFWLENVIIGGVNVLKMLFAGTGAKDLPPHGSAVFWVIKLFLIPFFCAHYGIFTMVHGIFIVGLFDKGAHHNFGDFGFPLIFQIIRDNHLTLPLIGLVISHLVSFGWDYLRSGEFRHTNPLELMTQPYRRVVIMHLTIIFGGFLMMALHSPESGLVFLVVLKTALDLWGHQNEREKFSTAKSPSLVTFTAPQAPALQNLLRSRMQAGTSQGIPARGFFVLILFLLFCAGFIGFVVYGFISPFFNLGHSHPAAAQVAVVSQPWTLDLNEIRVPETPAAGKFFGEDFSVKQAILVNKTLTLKDGGREFVITLDSVNGSVSGGSYYISTKSGSPLEIKMVAHKGPSYTSTQLFHGGYVLVLNFGHRTKNKIPAKIHLCLPDANKSHVAGTFEVTVKKDKNPPTTGEQSTSASQ